MLVRHWVEGDVEIRLEQAPFNSKYLKGLAMASKLDRANRHKYLLLRIEAGAVKTRRWLDDFPTCKDEMVALVATVSREGSTSIRSRLFDLVESHKVENVGLRTHRVTAEFEVPTD